tara:strand:+ start:2589 stop:3521 length:933 start_codon:yes stop_codon:yes gene_type:complete
MNVALIEIYPNKKLDKKKAIDAHLRNAIIISEYLKCDLLCVEQDFINALDKKYDILILAFASHYAPFQLIKKLLQNNPNAKKIVISNDVNFTSSIGGFKPYHLIAGYECEKSKSELSVNTLNINLLLAKQANNITNKKYDCIYYGTFRKDRKNYFTKYLQNDIYLSTSPKNFKKFKHIGCNPKYISKLSWREKKETLNLFKYQLYIEDNTTNKIFCNLANRYYEAGFCNNVVFFDSNCRNTIDKSELNYFKDQVEFYIVNSYADLQNKIKICNENFEKHLAIQKSWRITELTHRDMMLKELKNIIYNGQK